MTDKDKKPNIFTKILNAGEAILDETIKKAKSPKVDEYETQHKALLVDPHHNMHANGYREKSTNLSERHLKKMARANTIVGGIIQTQQNMIAAHSKLVQNDYEKGFRIVFKDRHAKIEEIITDLKEKDSSQNSKEENDSEDLNNWELRRQAKKLLEDEIKDRRKIIEDFIVNCGSSEDRTFESKKWNFDSYLRACVRDSLTYDKVATERIITNAGDLHSFIPIDGATIRYATPDLRAAKNLRDNHSENSLLFPEKMLDDIKEKTDILELDEELLNEQAYKYVQVVNGSIERAFIEEELAFGMRNPTTDIYNNGYSIAELELLVRIITAHLNVESRNITFFTQGFSSNGILHLKAPINRRKMETIRQQWHHMMKGTRNSWQTPIFTGMDDVKWIPLEQKSPEVESQGWMNYLIKVICSIYQIDPAAIGMGIKDAGAGGSSLSGDNTKEKLEFSMAKGLKPLLNFFQNYINRNIIESLDSDFELVFVGTDETKEERLARQEREVKFKKSVNDTREEDNLPPLPGMDKIILDPSYMQWFMSFSDDAKKQQEEAMAANDEEDYGVEKSLKKSQKPLMIEYYSIDDDDE